MQYIADELIRRFNLEPHVGGGAFRELYREGFDRSGLRADACRRDLRRTSREGRAGSNVLLLRVRAGVHVRALSYPHEG